MVGRRGRLRPPRGIWSRSSGSGRVREDHLEGFDEEETLAGRPATLPGRQASTSSTSAAQSIARVLPSPHTSDDGVLARVQAPSGKPPASSSMSWCLSRSPGVEEGRGRAGAAFGGGRGSATF